MDKVCSYRAVICILHVNLILNFTQHLKTSNFTSFSDDNIFGTGAWYRPSFRQTVDSSFHFSRPHKTLTLSSLLFPSPVFNGTPRNSANYARHCTSLSIFYFDNLKCEQTRAFSVCCVELGHSAIHKLNTESDWYPSVWRLFLPHQSCNYFHYFKAIKIVTVKFNLVITI